MNLHTHCQKTQIIKVKMKLEGRRRSTNVEDRRGRGTGKMVGGGIGIGAILYIIFQLLSGGDPSDALGQLAQQQQQSTQQEQVDQSQFSQEEQAWFTFAERVVGSTEDIWAKEFPKQLNRQYNPPGVVIFTNQTRTACGLANSGTGPFYCPADEKVYIDLSFRKQLARQFGASGDFAMAYVIAHEVAHHIQNELGYTDHVQRQRGRVSQSQYNDQSVRLELMADFLAGVWAHHEYQTFKSLDEQDIQEALNAAHAIGDDNIQKQMQGYVRPESFTHGTSAQRQKWFTLGLRTGDVSQGDTFNARVL